MELWDSGVTARPYDPSVPDTENTFPADLITLQRTYYDLDAQVTACIAEHDTAGDWTTETRAGLDELRRARLDAVHALYAHPDYPAGSGKERVTAIAALREAARAEFAAS